METKSSCTPIVTWRTTGSGLDTGTSTVSSVFETRSVSCQATSLIVRLPGDSAGLTGLNASQLTSGTVPLARLPAAVITDLLRPENKAKLQGILTYHVVAGQVMASDVVKLKNAKTVQGQEVAINTEKGVMVNDANVVKTDIVCSNGVIHVIDAVILPK